MLSGGSPVALEGIEDLVDAILYVWYPGQDGGTAVADILFGDANPAGRLPLTFPKSLDQLPPFEDYEMAKRTYRYSEAEPLFPFGFGLSYTQFAYSPLILDNEKIKIGEPVHVRVTLTNTGDKPGEEVVQVYLTDIQATAPVPHHHLVDFRRVSLSVGETRELIFDIPAEKMAFTGEDGLQHLEPGKFRLEIGGCSPGTRGNTLGAPKSGIVEFSLF